MNRWFPIRFAVAALMGCLVASAQVRIVGSDLLGAEFSASVLRAGERLGQPVTLALDGSRTGWGRLRDGQADMALLTLPNDEAERLGAFVLEPLAYHAVWVVVAPECPARAITLAQLAQAFGRGTGADLRWSDLGVAGDWAQRAVRALAPGADGGVGMELFRHAVLKGGRWSEDIVHFRDGDELAARFQRDRHAIALVTRPPDAARFRVLAVAKQSDESAVPPSRETLSNAKYPLRLPLWLAMRPEQRDALWAWIAWWRSAEAEAALARAGLVPALARTDAKGPE